MTRESIRTDQQNEILVSMYFVEIIAFLKKGQPSSFPLVIPFLLVQFLPSFLPFCMYS